MMESRSKIGTDDKLLESQEKNFRQAAANGDLELVKKLFSEGVNIHAVGPDTKKTALHWASEFARPDVVKFLISNGANIDKKDSKGNTSLNCAMQSKKGKLIDRVKLIEQLILYKGDPIAPNVEGKTPLMHFSLIRDDKELLTKPHLSQQVRSIIRKMKEHVAEIAVRKGMSARIKPNGEVIFCNAMQLLTTDVPFSGQTSLTAIDTTSSRPIVLAPHR